MMTISFQRVMILIVEIDTQEKDLLGRKKFLFGRNGRQGKKFLLGGKR